MSWEAACTYFLKDMAALAVLTAVLHLFIGEKLIFRKVFLPLTVLSFAALALSGHFLIQTLNETSASILDFISMCLFLVYAFVICEKIRFKRAVFTVLVCLCTTDMLFSLISPYLSGGFTLEYIAYIGIYALVTGVVFLSAKRSPVNFIPNMIEEISPFVFVALLVFDLTCYYKEYGASHAWYQILYTLSSVAMLIVVIYLICKVFYSISRQKMILRQIDAQKSFAEGQLNNDDELRRFRHDYSNHMAVVRALLAGGKTEDAEEYLSSITRNTDVILSNKSTGNFVADAILQNKRGTAGNSGIQISFSGYIPHEGVRNEDLCTVLANLLDNAIEHCRTLDDMAQITVTADCINNNLLLCVENPVRENIRIKNGLPTTKADRRAHGFGLKNIERVAEKYSGAVTVACENNVFNVSVRLRLLSEMRTDNNVSDTLL